MGGCPPLPLDKEGAAGDAVCPVPGGEAPIATLLRCHPHHNHQHQMRCEMSILPLASELNYRATTAPLSFWNANTQQVHAPPLADKCAR
jgi:hypothetical protein